MDNYKPLSEQAQAFKPGRYQHFKGGIYRAIGIARHSEDPKQEFVVYDHDGRLWIRPLAMFLEDVDRDGYTGPRFKYLGE